MDITRHPSSVESDPGTGRAAPPYSRWLILAGVFLVVSAVLPRGQLTSSGWWGAELLRWDDFAWIWQSAPPEEEPGETLFVLGQLGFGILAVWAGSRASRRTQALVIVAIPVAALAAAAGFYPVSGRWGFPPLDTAVWLWGPNMRSERWLHFVVTPGVLLVLLGAWRRSRARCLAGGLLLGAYLCWLTPLGEPGIVPLFRWHDVGEDFVEATHLQILTGLKAGFVTGFALLGLCAALPWNWRAVRRLILFASRAAVIGWPLCSAIAGGVDAHVAGRLDLLVPWVAEFSRAALYGSALMILFACTHGLAYERLFGRRHPATSKLKAVFE